MFYVKSIFTWKLLSIMYLFKSNLYHKNIYTIWEGWQGLFDQSVKISRLQILVTFVGIKLQQDIFAKYKKLVSINFLFYRVIVQGLNRSQGNLIGNSMERKCWYAIEDQHLIKLSNIYIIKTYFWGVYPTPNHGLVTHWVNKLSIINLNLKWIKH